MTTAATVALAGWLAVGVSEAAYGAAWPASPLPVQSVAAWLVAHHQRDGLAAYWQGTETTVASGGRVLVAPVTAARDRRQALGGVVGVVPAQPLPGDVRHRGTQPDSSETRSRSRPPVPASACLPPSTMWESTSS